ncbi:hypothetical protein [Nocardia africana]|uniref:Uncharacterized protein n=1 Tax=Nocardia africana TaxID=134964 RepID=A0A378X0U9_9NOCA|nr:hypothetical protein [Nocardia africana]MCC3312487.1 hypothetical protein [Nocardia africana]SUA46193.1 Uncharacterised protein [Nocardia africana]
MAPIPTGRNDNDPTAYVAVRNALSQAFELVDAMLRSDYADPEGPGAELPGAEAVSVTQLRARGGRGSNLALFPRGAGLLQRVERAVQRCIGHTQLRSIVAVTGSADQVPDAVADQAEAVVADTVAAVVAHAGAAAVVVTVTVADVLTLTIDTLDTTGTTTADALPTATVATVHARARDVGGCCRVFPGGRVSWTAPLPPHGKDATVHPIMF